MEASSVCSRGESAKGEIRSREDGATCHGMPETLSSQWTLGVRPDAATAAAISPPCEKPPRPSIGACALTAASTYLDGVLRTEASRRHLRLGLGLSLGLGLAIGWRNAPHRMVEALAVRRPSPRVVLASGKVVGQGVLRHQLRLGTCAGRAEEVGEDACAAIPLGWRWDGAGMALACVPS